MSTFNLVKSDDFNQTIVLTGNNHIKRLSLQHNILLKTWFDSYHLFYIGFSVGDIVDSSNDSAVFSCNGRISAVPRRIGTHSKSCSTSGGTCKINLKDNICLNHLRRNCLKYSETRFLTYPWLERTHLKVKLVI